MGLTVAAGAYMVMNHSSNPVSDAVDENVVDREFVPFPYFVYRGEVIQDARDAYSALYDAAYVDEDVDQDEVKRLYDVLIKYGGAYASMAEYIKDDLGIFG